MAIRIELTSQMVRDFVNMKIASNERYAKQHANPIIQDALHKENDKFREALSTMTEIK